MGVHSEVLFTLLSLSFFAIKRWGEASLILNKKKQVMAFSSLVHQQLRSLVLPASLQVPERTLHPHLLQCGFCCQHPPETPQERSPHLLWQEREPSWEQEGGREALPPNPEDPEKGFPAGLAEQKVLLTRVIPK